MQLCRCWDRGINVTVLHGKLAIPVSRLGQHNRAASREDDDQVRQQAALGATLGSEKRRYGELRKMTTCP
jgi:hypothetical protein